MEYVDEIFVSTDWPAFPAFSERAVKKQSVPFEINDTFAAGGAKASNGK